MHNYNYTEFVKNETQGTKFSSTLRGNESKVLYLEEITMLNEKEENSEKIIGLNETIDKKTIN